MRSTFQFGVALLAAATSLALGPRACAQTPHSDRPPQAAHPAPVHPPQNHANENRPPSATNHPPSTASHPPSNPNSGNYNQSHISPPASYSNSYRPPNEANPNLRPRQQMGVGAPRPWVDTMRDLSPSERDRVLQNSRAFQSLSPDKQNRIRQQFSQWDHMSSSQQADLRSKERTWRELTPNQRDYIKNQVLPKWRQMPWDRQQVMKQKLSILQNMPESARNQRLNDPNFTGGMTEDEKSMLRTLSHTHVAGEAPQE